MKAESLSPSRRELLHFSLGIWTAVSSSVLDCRLAVAQPPPNKLLNYGKGDSASLCHDQDGVDYRVATQMWNIGARCAPVSIHFGDAKWRPLLDCLSRLEITDRIATPYKDGYDPDITSCLIYFYKAGVYSQYIAYRDTRSPSRPGFFPGFVDGRRVFLKTDLPIVLREMEQRSVLKFASPNRER